LTENFLRRLPSKFEKQRNKEKEKKISQLLWERRSWQPQGCFFFFFSSCTQWSNFISVWNGKGGCLFRLRPFSNDFNTHWNLWAKYSRDKVCNEDLSSQLKFQSQWKCYLIPSPYFQFLYLCSVFTFMIGGLVHHFSRENYSFSGSQQWNQTGWSSCLKIRFIKPTDTSDLKSRR